MDSVSELNSIESYSKKGRYNNMFNPMDFRFGFKYRKNLNAFNSIHLNGKLI